MSSGISIGIILILQSSLEKITNLLLSPLIYKASISIYFITFNFSQHGFIVFRLLPLTDVSLSNGGFYAIVNVIVF